MFGIEIREEAKHMITGLKDQKTIINITTIMARNARHAPALYSGYLMGTWFN
jgi:hypothetical protein